MFRALGRGFRVLGNPDMGNEMETELHTGHIGFSHKRALVTPTGTIGLLHRGT